MKKLFMFVFAMIVSFIPGGIGIVFSPTTDGNIWYNSLLNSGLTPAAWVFPLVWIVLYTLLGVALFLIMAHSKTRLSKRPAYLLFLAQMALNALWSYVFFGLHMIGAAMIVVLLLIIVVIWMARVFMAINRWASWLIWPYVLWLILAAYLNGAILYLN